MDDFSGGKLVSWVIIHLLRWFNEVNEEKLKAAVLQFELENSTCFWKIISKLPNSDRSINSWKSNFDHCSDLREDSLIAWTLNIVGF